jgi:RHS repeat-associated protein
MANSTSRPVLFPARFYLATVLSLLLSSGAAAQSEKIAARPDRGTIPNGSYSVSDIENINLQNGNVNLSIPLASLPPIAGGKLSWTISAIYNSKLWNITRTEADADDTQYRPYVIDTPQLSELGGWRISGQYQITIRYAQEDFDYLIPPPDAIPYSDYQLLLNYNWYKVVLSMPDGSEHELRPTDYSPYPGGQDFLKGYYKESPYQYGAMRYYSFDGSYLYATITTDNNWIIYMPDGTRIIQTPDGIQRIQDTNGNKIKIYSDSNGTHYQDEQTGREIRYSYNASGNGGNGQGRVDYQTVGGDWKYIYINFGTTNVQGQVYRVKDWMPGDLFACQRFNELNQDVPVVREIILPQTEPGVTRKFTFNYNSDTTETATTPNVRFSCSDPMQNYTRTRSKGWGSLSEVVSPSGATIKYSYSLDTSPLPTNTDMIAEESITQKQLTHDGTTDTWMYSIINNTSTVTNPDNSTVTENKYSHKPGFAYAIGKAGLVYRSTRPFTKIERHWTDIVFSGAHTDSPVGPVSFNPVVDVEYTTLLDASNNALKMSAKAFQYDYNGNLLQTTEYDWFDPALVSRDAQGVPTGVPASATVLRVTSNSHYNPATSSTSGNVYAKRSLSTGAPLILNAVQQTSVGPSVTQHSYDGQPYGIAPTAGNITFVSRLDNQGDPNPANDIWISVGNSYGSYGNLATTTDARGKVTQFFYDDATHAVPTRVVVDPQNGTGTQTATTTYDYYTGVATSVTDPNGQTSTMDYTNQLLGTVDPFARPGMVSGPAVIINGTAQRQRIKSFYHDYAQKLIVILDLNAETDGLLKSETLYDQLGRIIETRHYETGMVYIATKRTYDPMGRVSQVSNPYRSGGTIAWTINTYDGLGRILTVTTPDSATVSTSYSGNQTTVTDQRGRVRTSLTDALGQLKQVVEDPNYLAYQTDYSYDALGNLSAVSQGVQSRYFMYDSLSRLIRVKNPEQAANASLALSDPTSGNNQWSLGYTYDNNGNLATKTDARGVTATYTYDALNRNTAISYSDSTPAVVRYYDGAINGKGRLWLSYAGSSHTAIDSYDAAGRPLYQRQHFYSSGSWGAAYVTQRTYKLSGAVATQTYPSGRTINYTYDQAGRVSDFTGNLGDGVTRIYADSISYDEWGGISRERFGTDTQLYHKEHRNVRGQLYDMRLSTVNDDWNWNRGAVVNYYNFVNYGFGTSGSDNNGNLLIQQHWVPADDAISSYSFMQQNYDYDSLNRLIWMAEFPNGGSSTGSQSYAYDHYGNRTVSGWGTGINTQQFAVDANTNRLGVPVGQPGLMQYDSAGNLINDTYSGHGARSYDAENRMTTAVNSASQQSVYTYDADGKRVRRNSYNQEVWQVYGMDGELLAEYAANAAPSSPQKEYGYRNGELLVTAEGGANLRWLISDQLGTPRMVADRTGSLAGIKRHDYLPFGEELYAGAGGRTAQQGYAGDSVRQQFTGYERDNETGLDYAQARYFSSNHGRFTTPDPLIASGRPALPQSWNRYAYVLNNPLRNVDPTGLKEEDYSKKKDKKQEAQPQRQTPVPTRPKAVDLRKDRVITGELAKIRANAKPLSPGELPVVSDVKVIPGDTYDIKDGSIIDAYGRESVTFTGTVRPIAYAPLDQGGNVYAGGELLIIKEEVKLVSGVMPTTSDPYPQPPDFKVFLDIQSTGPGIRTTTIKQEVLIEQYNRLGAYRVFKIENEIIKNAAAKTISVTLGSPQRIR